MSEGRQCALAGAFLSVKCCRVSTVTRYTKAGKVSRGDIVPHARCTSSQAYVWLWHTESWHSMLGYQMLLGTVPHHDASGLLSRCCGSAAGSEALRQE